jgi:hypothetical protein
MGAFAQILAALAGLAKVVLSVFKARQLRQAGQDAQVKVQQEQVIRNVELVKEAQRDAERDLRAPGGVLEDDGFRRD